MPGISGMFDIYIALLVAGSAIALFVMFRMGALTKKSLPWIIAGLAGIFGFSLFRARRADDLRKKLKDLERQAEAGDQKIAKLKETLGAEDRELQRIEAEKRKNIESLQREEEGLRQAHGQRIEEIARAPDTETAAAVDAILGGTRPPR